MLLSRARLRARLILPALLAVLLLGATATVAAGHTAVRDKDRSHAEHKDDGRGQDKGDHAEGRGDDHGEGKGDHGRDKDDDDAEGKGDDRWPGQR